jgi:hypothetical protein
VGVHNIEGSRSYEAPEFACRADADAIGATQRTNGHAVGVEVVLKSVALGVDYRHLDVEATPTKPDSEVDDDPLDASEIEPFGHQEQAKRSVASHLSCWRRRWWWAIQGSARK